MAVPSPRIDRPASEARVLLAHGDPRSSNHLRSLLTKVGYCVIPAQNGAQARYLLHAEDSPGLAVVDWDLPGVTGLELCRELQLERERRSHYLLLLTPWNVHNDRVRGLEAGADDCLPKPVDARELQLRLQKGAQTLLERKLRESEERFRGAFECAGVGMALLRLNGDFLQVNRALCDLLSYSSGELRCMNLCNVTRRENIIPSDSWLQRFCDEGHRSGEFEKQLIAKDGSYIWGLLTISTIMDADDRPASLVLQVQDNHQRKQAEEALHAAKVETEIFLQAIPSVLIGLDSQGVITRWNRVAEKSIGLRAENVVGKPLLSCGVKWLHPDMAGEIQRWLNADSIYLCDILPFERDGHRKILGLKVRRVEATERSQKPWFIISGADVTERKSLEEQLRQAQKMEAIGQLAAGIAHEINTPTQYVSDNIQFLKESWPALAKVIEAGHRLRGSAPATDEVDLSNFDTVMKEADIGYLLQEVPNAIQQSAEGLQRVAKIVRAIKEFSHPGNEEKRPIDLNKAIESTVTVTRNEWKYVADMQLELDVDLAPVVCLAGEFNQVMVNLIVNAAQAIAQSLGKDPTRKGAIRITTRRIDSWVEISVTDTGGGIPPEVRPRIFEPFFTTKPVGHGTGQGLALAHSVVVKRHQGQIWFGTEVGKGTTFHIRLPMEGGAKP